MKLDYDAEADVLTLVLSDGKPDYGEDNHPDVVLHVNKEGRLIMIEVQAASTHTSIKDLVISSPDQLLSLSEAAHKTGLTAGTLRKLCQSGRLRAMKVGRRWLTTREWLKECLQSRNYNVKSTRFKKGVKL